MDWNVFYSVLVKILVALLTIGIPAGIGYLFSYFKRVNPKGFSDLLAAANIVVRIIKNIISANPEIKTGGEQIAQQIWELFKQEIVKLVPYITEDEIESLFKAVIDEISADLDVPVTSFKAVKIKTSNDTYKMLFN